MSNIFLVFMVALAIAGCNRNQSTQELNLATHKCFNQGLRAIGLHDSDGKYYILCHPHKPKPKVRLIKYRYDYYKGHVNG